MNFKVTKTEKSRFENINYETLGFGVHFSDHVFISRYKDGKWDDGAIEPYGLLPFEPGLCVFHYGQSIFEGLKAFESLKGGVNIFRPDMNVNRLNRSAEIVCIPTYDEERLLAGIRELVKIDAKFIPRKKGQSLYIRPVVFGSGHFLGVTAASEYHLIVMTSPVASYYAAGLNPVKIMVSTDHVRAVQGGVGAAKTAANYAASLWAGMDAHKRGFSQVLWLDGVNRKDIDEVGAMNIMFVIDDELITPSLSKGTVLAGVTRNTVLTLAKEFGMKVSERNISIDEVAEAHANGRVKEVFGTGTAAVISPVGLLEYKGKEMIFNGMKIGPVAQKFYDTITSIQYGEVEDTHKWNQHVDL
ncbi:MAG: branched-chain amino acid aminotransferase [Ignavibacteriae bacterium]|nr:branched-chain amino acid aminotransferase [Ignavibacteriota bacterium]